MSRTCGDCGSSWDGGATFCGRCGGLLDEGLATRGRDRGSRARWRPWVGAVVATALVVGAVAAVPRLTIERTPPVDGEIGVPAEDDLNAAPASARTRDRAPEPAEIRCTLDGAPVECVRWSRNVLPPEGLGRGGGWFTAAGDHHLVAAGNDGFAVFDATTGTRLWRAEELQGSYPLDVVAGRILLDGPQGTTLRSLEDGTVLWTAPSGSGFLGGLVVDDVVVLGQHAPDGTTRLEGRGVEDGVVVWEQDLAQAMHVAGEVPGGRLILESVDGSPARALVDAATGEVTRFEVPPGWLAGFTGGVALFVSEPRRDPAEPNLAGDGGATLTAVSLADGTVAWTRPLRSTQRVVGIASGTVLAPSSDRVVALDVTTGQVRWELDLGGSLALADHGSGAWWGPGGHGDDWSTVAVVHDQVDDLVRAHDLGTGEVLWERTLDRGFQHVFVAGDVLMVHHPDGVTLLDPASGDERVSVDLGGGHLAGLDPLTVVHPPSGHGTLLDLAGVDVP